MYKKKSKKEKSHGRIKNKNKIFFYISKTVKDIPKLSTDLESAGRHLSLRKFSHKLKNKQVLEVKNKK